MRFLLMYRLALESLLYERIRHLRDPVFFLLRQQLLALRGLRRQGDLIGGSE